MSTKTVQWLDYAIDDWHQETHHGPPQEKAILEILLLSAKKIWSSLWRSHPSTCNSSTTSMWQRILSCFSRIESFPCIPSALDAMINLTLLRCVQLFLYGQTLSILLTWCWHCLWLRFSSAKLCFWEFLEIMPYLVRSPRAAWERHRSTVFLSWWCTRFFCLRNQQNS